MKKLVILSAIAMFSGAMAQAQSNGNNAATPAKVESKETLKPAVKGEAAPVDPRTQLEQLDRSIVELEKFINENHTREGFDRAAYDNRLNILRNRSKELSATLNENK
ncbi:MAG: hypothetical protein K9J06_06685 [Flavobacteriales bacterium]|nr:hypothetical protein [Flavobacteriales bacterium]